MDIIEKIKTKIGLTRSFIKRKKRKNFNLIKFTTFVFGKEIKKT